MKRYNHRLVVLPILDIVKHNENTKKQFQSPLEKSKREPKSESNGITFYK